MKLSPVIPLLHTDDLPGTVTFYTSALGFTCEEHNDEWGWALLHLDDCEIMFPRPNEHAAFSKPVFSGSFYIKTENVLELWQALKDKVQICYPLETFEWGMREFAIYDNNGYVFQFGEEVSAEE